MLSPTSTRHPSAHFEIGLRPSRRLSSVVEQQTETESETINSPQSMDEPAGRRRQGGGRHGQDRRVELW